MSVPLIKPTGRPYMKLPILKTTKTNPNPISKETIRAASSVFTVVSIEIKAMAKG